MKPQQGWRKTGGEILHQNDHFLIRKDAVIKPDGVPGMYYWMQTRGASFIVALDERQRVCLIDIDRYPINLCSVEVPGGGMDGEDPFVAAKRELREEAGLHAKTWKNLGTSYPADGIVLDENHVFLATELEEIAGAEQAEEGIGRVSWVPVKEAMRMIKDNQIVDQQTITALTLVSLELGLVAID
jgi:8-oxo-dGDP phosphatase